MKRFIATLSMLTCLAVAALAQAEIRVSPRSVNVYSQGATTVFLTYGNLGDYRPAETQWCGDIQPAAPAIGSACVPGTIYGTLPTRFDVSRRSGTNGYTDVVSVPASVARKAYQAAAAGQDSQFFYVRRFISASGLPDQFVVVTMRLTGNGIAAPFSLTDVQLGFGPSTGISASGQEPQILFIEPGKRPPAIRAEIKYTGAGRLRGRWEVVRPGDSLPDARDLLPEASLPVEERGAQARFTQLARFNVFLPSGGRYTLPGPDPARLPVSAPGQYLILLRIEASDDGLNSSNLSAVGAGAGIVNSGAAAGFALPVLRYVVGGGDNRQTVASVGQFLPVLPEEGTTLAAGHTVEFVWTEMPQASLYRLEIEDEAGKLIHSAILKSNVRTYRAPSWLSSKLPTLPTLDAKAGNVNLRWRVVALDQAGKPVGGTARRGLTLNR
ncbi:MAG: hypothetical protein M3X11_17840 [Acidobacteriota bacterium]|nr:hypothetical protein [Acidobacteriota bacterium]